MKLTTVHLDSGYRVRCRGVPSIAMSGNRYSPDLWMPHPPRIKVKTLAGEETADAPTDSPEYETYLRKQQEVLHLRDLEDRNFQYGYGIVDWVLDREGEIPESEFESEPPKKWSPHPMMEDRLETKDRRLLWIMSELIISTDDLRMTTEATLSLKLSLAEEGEVGAAEDSFPGDVEESADQGT